MDWKEIVADQETAMDVDVDATSAPSAAARRLAGIEREEQRRKAQALEARQA